MDKCREDKCCLDKCHITVGICSRCSQGPIFKFSSKSGQIELRYSWYGQMLPGQMLPGQISPWQLESVLDVHRNLPLKFHQNRVSNSWDIADIEFLWWVVVGGVQSHFHVQPNCSVEVVLCCIVVGVVTIVSKNIWQKQCCSGCVTPPNEFLFRT